MAVVLDLIIHLDQHLALFTATYGHWVYALLFLIVFCETGLVVTPFLPGDSLLFVAGAIAATGALDIGVLMAVLLLAALLGDNCNYWVGRWLGAHLLRWGEASPRLFNRKAFDQAHDFYVRWGAVTMTVARFIPLVRTFAPFVAGVARMDYRRYLFFDSLGAVLWVGLLTGLGFAFGNIPIVKNNLWAVILVIIAVSVLPMVLSGWRARRARRAVAGVSS
jgi:membrane-associated protein